MPEAAVVSVVTVRGVGCTSRPQHRNDKAAFAKCYRDLVTRNPGEQSQLLLGEAYLRIQQPEDAIEAFEEALKLNPSNSALASKIGKALVLTHDYERAVAYYEAALSHAPNDTKLRSDLTELFCKLKKFDEAQRLLSVALASDETQDVATLITTVKNLMLLAKVHAGTGNVQEAIKALQQSAQVQNNIMSQLRGVGAGACVGNKAAGALTPPDGDRRASHDSHGHDCVLQMRSVSSARSPRTSATRWRSTT